ncbi:histidine phosphatase family protein [Hydrogenophaga sp. PAMC20947]|uniref:histidine phosphatase family protein n=1 Tax=Hydrogenophaga sp. PAMC20947 TaxID=2565558 RepID=UPI00109E0E06|nr:histidine phosphatase family protein [Hydrogenophaga sp. PAMC20947]QCB46348.1 histidine phosphatase family protein [Hydrogenophaga sp. PAMC20947]
MRLWLVRHGQSLANQQKRVTGTQLDPLAPEGRLQAIALGELLGSISLRPDRLICSPWLRAKQTAELALPSKTLHFDGRIGETDAGQAADLPLSEFLHSFPEFYKNAGNRYPGGESHLELNSRMADWIDELRSKGFSEVLAICHSGPICCLLQRALNIPMTSFPALLPAHASLSMIEYGDASFSDGQVKLFSQISKLGLQQMVSTKA